MPALQTAIPQLPLDLVIYALFAVLVAIDAMRNGTRRSFAFVLAAPLTLYLYPLLSKAVIVGPYISSPAVQQYGLILQGILFLVLLGLIFKILSPSYDLGTYPLQGLFAGLAAGVVLASVEAQVSALRAYFPASKYAALIFDASYAAYWILAALILLVFARLWRV